MIRIIKAASDDYALLADIGKQTFIESHGHSAPAADIASYVLATYSHDSFKNELANGNNIYHKILYADRLAGYSKLIFNSPHNSIPFPNVTKLERIYLLKDFYDLKLGLALLTYNIELSKKNGQSGMWLFVWKENERAVNFYSKNGFKITGSYDFSISASHSNPNHQLLLTY
jgi:ribosomal protein S18 acetylase RimI-like enzyme